MTDLAIDTTTHDLIIEDGDLVLTTGANRVRQDLDIRLRTVLGVWFLDTRIGIPYFESILGQKPRFGPIAAIFKEAILEAPGVIRVEDFQLDFNGATRALTVSFRCVAETGTFDYQTELII